MIRELDFAEGMHSLRLILLLLVELALGDSDLNALLELKKGIQRDPSGKILTSWNSNSLTSDGCPKNWYGVICSNGRVTAITLNDVGLIGEFQLPAITGLEMLQSLNISNNQLTGLVSKIGLIKSLEFLDISQNLFHGTIPSDITNLKNLVFLNISLNNFEGRIPSGFANFEKLKYLDFRSTGFSGDVMNLVSELGSLIHVDLSSNQFSGTLDMGLANSSFVSTIQYLNVSHNSLTGELFSHDGMPYFDSLEVFDASNNQLTGAIPSFNFVVSLRILRLGSNHLSGSLPEALLKESSMVLSELDFSINQLEGPLWSITSSSLKSLNLSSNKLSGSLPYQIGHCAIIDLSNNMLSGNLSRIRTWGNYVELIDLSSNSLTGILPNQTSQFLRLSSLKISNNSLSGTLPLVLTTYPELKSIDFSHNELGGSLIPSLFTSSRLSSLNLSGNNFTGPLDLPSLENSSLTFLDLSHNSLSGNLPIQISDFHNMMYFNVSNNNFEGMIPNSFPNELEGFDVSYNNLSGIVPENLLKFPSSAFHPGNLLLIFPHSLSSSPHVIPDPNIRAHNTHMKSAVRAVLISIVTGGAATIALLCIMIFYKKSHHKKSIQQVGPPSPASAPHKYSDPPVPCNQLQLDRAKDPKRDDGISSPMSQHISENPSLLEVYSPDKMAGDLHLFHSNLIFTAEELSRAPAEVVGRSCHGTLCKATLESGYLLAVKWLRNGIAKGRKEFSREAKKLGNIRHPNLVSYIGFYWGPKEHEKLIISNYIDAPSLAIYLHETEPRKIPPLSLQERLKVAIEIAQCLNYLHNERAIPHGNIKSTNILLQLHNMNALLTDYSLHRIMNSAGTSEQVLNAAALGYRPPEFAGSSKPCPSLMSDVYAFGVILLELLTGKSSSEIIPASSGAVDLTEWVKLLAGNNRSVECFDRVILGSDQLHLRVLDNVLQVALRCVLPASERPDMRMALHDLLLIEPHSSPSC